MDESRRCTARSKRSGERCKRAAIVGGTVCNIHGGKAQQVAKAAERNAKRQAVEREASRMAALDGVEVDPIDHLLDSLHRASQLVKVWTQMVAELDDLAAEENANAPTRGGLSYEEDTDEKSPYELHVRSQDRLLGLNRHGEAGVHPFVKELNDALDRRAKFAKMCLDAGVAKRQVELYEQQVEIAYGAFEAGLAALDLDNEQKRKARKAYADQLRSA